MRILAISYLYPNSIYPNNGIFVLNRLKAIQKYCEVKVINPIPWFPLYSKFRRYKNYHQIPKKEVINDIEVFHPRYFIIPRYCKFLDALTFALAVVPLALKIQKTYPYQLIDLHWTYPDLLAGRMLARILRMKQLVTIRGKEALLWGFKGIVYHREVTIRSKILNNLLPKSDFVITLSKDLKDLCVSYEVCPQNIEVIPNGVDSSTFYFKGRDSCRSLLELSQNERIILSVGSLVYGKGFDRIIRSFPEILKQYPDSALYIIGSAGPAGDYRNGLYKLVRQYDLEKKVHFMGKVKNSDLLLWYNAADIFCLASRSEGSPNVLSEALACGCPSVATNVGSVSEILSQNFMGIVVPNNGKMLLSGLLDALSRRYERQKISKFMQQYDWDWCARNVLQVYRKVLEK